MATTARKERKLTDPLTKEDAASARRKINDLGLSQAWRVRLRKLIGLTATVGKRVYQIGLKIIDCIVGLKRRFPDTTVVLIAGAVLTFLASWIPLFGTVLAPLIAGVTVVFATVEFIREIVKGEFRSIARACGCRASGSAPNR